MWFEPPDDLKSDPVFAVRVHRDGSAVLILDEDPPKPRRTKRGRVFWVQAPNLVEAIRRARNLL